MNLLEKITIDPNICNGNPTIREKRITVKTIIEFLSASESEEDILKQYPSLDKDDIKACSMFASKIMDSNFILKKVS